MNKNQIKGVLVYVLLLCLLVAKTSVASELKLSQVTQTIGSVPYTNSGFDYSDPFGNSVGVSNTQYVPVSITTLPYGNWVPARNGDVPANAIVFQYINGNPTFYCAVQIDSRFYSGELVPNQGCFVLNGPEQPFNSYLALVR